MKTILLIMIGLSMLVNAASNDGFTDDFTRDFTRDADGIVSDSRTGLLWQDDYSDNDDANVTKTTWTDALTYCEGLTLGGNDDWRLPNYNELYSIGDRSKFNPAINSIFEKVMFDDPYWSSSTYVFSLGSAWTVVFNNGSALIYGKTVTTYVRCVRDGQ